MACDALIVSDFHLGSKRKARPRLVRAFFDALRCGELPHRPKKIILNGDVLDDLDFRKWPKSHWEALSAIRSAARVFPTEWVIGNHDGSPQAVEALCGSDINLEEVSAIFQTGDKTVVAMHGHDKHVFGNKAIAHKQGITHAATMKALCDQWVYKRSRVMEAVRIARAAVFHAQDHGRQGVVCGHTHGAFSGVLDGIHYANSGSWTSGYPATYVVATQGRLELHAFAPQRNCDNDPTRRDG